MAKKIKGDDIIEDNHLENAIKSGEALLKTYKDLDAQIVKTAKDMKAIGAKTDAGSAKGIKALNTALSESEKKKKAVLKIDKERANLEVKLKALNSDKIRQNERLKILASQKLKSIKQEERETLGLVGAYEKESKLLIKLRKELKDLIIAEGEGGKKTKELAKRVNELDGRLKKADAAAGQFQRNVGNYPSALKGAISSLKKFAGALGLFGGIQLAVRGIRNMFDVVKNFDQATADLTSVLGVNADEMENLTAQAKELGATTKFTASQVSELQLEFAKLGFTQKEIQDVTEATLQLAAAAGTDLGNAATIVGSTIRAFGLDTSETQRIVDVMAESFSSSSLDIEKFKNAMAAVAPVAKTAGLSVEETTALIGTLTDAGIDAGTAGTGLRNIFLELTKSGMSFDEAMKAINSSTNKNKTALDLFGKRGAALGVILAENGVATDALTEKLENSAGAAEEMADKQLNTLGGAVELLKSAWEGFILKLNDASGAGSGLTKVIKFLANNLETILNTVVLVTKGFIAYKVATFAATKALKLYSFAQNVATKGLKAFSTASKANPFGLIISAIVVLLPLLSSFGDMIFGISDNVEELTLKQKVLNDVTSETADRLVDEKAELVAVFDALKNTTAGTIERKEALDKVNQKYGLTLKNLEDETAFVNQLNKAYENLVSTLEQKIRTEVIREQLTKLIKEKILVEMEMVRLEQSIALQLEETNKTFQDFDPLKIEESGVGRTAAERLLLGQKGRLEELNNAIIALQNNVSSTDILGDVFEDVGKGVGGTTGKVKELKTELEDLQSFMDKADEVFLPEDKDADFAAFQRNLKQNTRDFETELRKRGVSEKEIQKQLDERKLQDLILERNRALEIYGEYSQKFLDLDLAVRREVDKRNKQQEDDIEEAERKKREKQLKDAKEAANKMIEISKILADNKIAQIDREIEARKNEISVSESEIGRLQDLAAAGNVDAAESIKAERVRQAKDKIEIENLEKKKADLLLKIATLNQANLLFQQSDVNGFQNANAKVKEFVSNLPTFYDGTTGTVADALGATGTRDGHMVRVHDNEHIIGSNDSTTLHAAGLKNNADIVGSALAYQNAAANNKALAANKIASFTDSNIVNELHRCKESN